MNKEFSTFADGSDCKECAALERNVEALKQRLAAAEAARSSDALAYEHVGECLRASLADNEQLKSGLRLIRQEYGYKPINNGTSTLGLFIDMLVKPEAAKGGRDE